MSRRLRLDPRRAKLHLNYTVAEAARLFGVHRNTVNAWLKAGLRSFMAGRTRLILGEDLRAFLEKRRRSRRNPLRPGHMHCMACREARTPDPELIEWVSNSAGGGGNLRGLCPRCGALMHRRIGRAGPSAAGFPGAATRPDSHLSNASGPCVNSATRKSA
ncbi:MAG: helix-turn-helix domain-containing protein [Caulobacter sp.]